MDQIVHDSCVRGAGSDADSSVPILFGTPDGVVKNFDPVGIPKLDAAVGAAGDEIVASAPSPQGPAL